MKKLAILTLFALAVSCQKTEIKKIDNRLFVAYETDLAENGDVICFGGYGSAMGYDAKSDIYYLLTDRGPNVDGTTPESKMFPYPEFSPTVGKFKREGDSLILLEKIILKQSDGISFLGLPNRDGDGVTGEVAYNIKGEIVTSSYRGLDSEGFTLCEDGSFWVSDEYAPFVMHFSPDGTLIKEFSPSKGLPAHFAARRPNRGMEGLTISKDQTKLYGIMQSPLYLPDSRTKNKSSNNRILEIDLDSGATREFVYCLESSKLVVSDILFESDSTMLVLERNGKFGTDPAAIKNIYRINIASATDVSDMEIELMSKEQLKTANVEPVAKSLVIDILKEIPGYSHDKAEGMTFVSPNVLAIVNDDDFSAFETNDGGFRPKYNLNGEVDHSVVYFVDLK